MPRPPQDSFLYAGVRPLFDEWANHLTRGTVASPLQGIEYLPLASTVLLAFHPFLRSSGIENLNRDSSIYISEQTTPSPLFVDCR